MVHAFCKRFVVFFTNRDANGGSVAAEDVACVDFFLYIVERAVISVGDDGLRLCLELGKVVDDAAAEECCAVLNGGFVDDDLGALCLDAFHDSLD